MPSAASSPGSRPRSARRPAGQAQRWNSDVLASCAFCPPPFSFTPPAFERRGEEARWPRGTRGEGGVRGGDAGGGGASLRCARGDFAFPIVRSGERRVGEEGRFRGAAGHLKKKKKKRR